MILVLVGAEATASRAPDAVVMDVEDVRLTAWHDVSVLIDGSGELSADIIDVGQVVGGGCCHGFTLRLPCRGVKFLKVPDLEPLEHGSHCYEFHPAAERPDA